MAFDSEEGHPHAAPQHGRALYLRPEDWESLGDYSDARSRGRTAEAILRELYCRDFRPEDAAAVARSNGAEIAAVFAGRKPLFHETVADSAFAPEGPSLAAMLKLLPAGVRIHRMVGHLIVFHNAALRRILDSDAEFYRPHGEDDLGALARAIRHACLGELLGYGARTLTEKDCLTVHLFDHKEMIGGFRTRTAQAPVFAAARARDHADYLGRPVDFELI